MSEGGRETSRVNAYAPTRAQALTAVPRFAGPGQPLEVCAWSGRTGRRYLWSGSTLGRVLQDRLVDCYEPHSAGGHVSVFRLVLRRKTPVRREDRGGYCRLYEKAVYTDRALRRRDPLDCIN